MKRWILVGLFVTSSLACSAYMSAIAIQAEKFSSMQVFVNGKLFNKDPENFVRIRSAPGLYTIQVKVLNPHNKEWYMLKRQIRVEKGFEFFYRVVFSENNKPALVAVKRYPVYSKYFLNPALYNKHPIT
ncbi:hypothetical protein QQ054_21240 [Oscillatoria amoena NRMC-F 0135]|nr:hypothetical protein [Oscillatoria amoena NRMC-F 0135]